MLRLGKPHEEGGSQNLIGGGDVPKSLFMYVTKVYLDVQSIFYINDRSNFYINNLHE